MGRSNSPTAFGPTRTAEVGTAVSNLNPHIHPTRRTSRSTEMISQNRSTLAGLCLLFLAAPIRGQDSGAFCWHPGSEESRMSIVPAGLSLRHYDGKNARLTTTPPL